MRDSVGSLYSKKEITIDTAQYITDMHKIALHEEIVLEMPSEILPFGEEALEERVMLSRAAH